MKETVKTIARGMPGCSGEPVVTTSCAFYFLHARLRVHRARGIPCALSFEGGRFQSSGVFMPRECGGVCDLAESLRGAKATKQSIFDLAMPSHGLLRSARNDGLSDCRGCLKNRIGERRN